MSAIGAGAGGTSGTASAGAEPGDGAGTGRSLRVDAFAPQSVWALAAGRPLLARFNEAGVLAAADVHVALRLGALTGEQDERVLLAVALGVCAVRTGSVCTTLEDAPALADAGRASSPDPAMVLGVPAWPDLPDWREALLASPMIAVGHEGPADRPVRWVDGRIYLDRYWRDEQVVRTEVDARLAEPLGSGTDREDAIAAVARQLFPAAEQDRQRVAAATTALSRITVLTGGPGTGKTTTVAGSWPWSRRSPTSSQVRALPAPPYPVETVPVQTVPVRKLPGQRLPVRRARSGWRSRPRRARRPPGCRRP